MHFFVKYHVDKKDITDEYCPTRNMLSDFFTKPLQGRLFKKFIDIIMGYKHIGALASDYSFLKEHF